jgi:hypothetical protein
MTAEYEIFLRFCGATFLARSVAEGFGIDLEQSQSAAQIQIAMLARSFQSAPFLVGLDVNP